MTGAEPLVLVVEDEPQMRRFLRACLTSHGYRLVEAGSVREAEQLATSHNPEVVLLDLGLPDGDGIELTRRLREWTRVPVIVVSTELDEASGLGDRILVMYRGRIVGIVPSTTPRDVLGLMMAGIPAAGTEAA